jgi:endoglucanase
MKKYNHITLLLSLLLTTWGSQAQQAQTTSGSAATARAATLGKGMNLSVWLESSYWFYNTTTFPDVTRYTASDIAAMHAMCFNTVRLPVFFEPFAPTTPPYAWDMSNQNVVHGLAYVDSVIAWTAANGMDLIIDNHLEDDVSTDNLQANYQITDVNYVSQAALIAAVWRQAIQRYGYADPNHVFFELRNEPNSVSDANLRIVYQTIIDTVRTYDQTHTLIVGNTGYYDATALSQSTPYSDTNLIYTFHIYDGNAYPGFCFQGVAGVPATDSLAGTHVSFALNGAQAADITSEVQAAQQWSSTNNVPVWLGEFGCSTLPQVYHDDTSRCNYVKNMADALAVANTPWCYWGGYVPEGLFTSYDGGTTLNYMFSIFDGTNILSASHLTSCFASDLSLGGTCTNTGISNINAEKEVTLYPNPSNGKIFINAPGASAIGIYNVVGEKILMSDYNKEVIEINTSSLSAGVYFARIEFADGTHSTKKFVKE